MFKHLLAMGVVVMSANVAQASNLVCKNDEGCPITLIEPTIQNPQECLVGDDYTLSYEYTVKNNTFTDVELTIFLDPDTDEVEINEANSTCYDNPNPPSVLAQDTCTIVIDILIEDCQTSPPPYSIIDQLVVEPHDVKQGPIESDIQVDVVQSSFLTIVPGVNTSEEVSVQANNPPLLVTHTADGLWENIDTSTFPAGEFRSGTCTGTDDNGICIAVGTGFTGSLLTTEPEILILSSQDGGDNWSPPVTPAFSITGQLNSVACSNDGDDSAFCMAVGGKPNGSDAFYLISGDGGENWDDQHLINAGGSFVDVACTDVNIPGGFCVYSGQFADGAFLGNLLFPSVKDHTEMIPFTQLSKKSNNDIILATACTGTSYLEGDTVCTFVGYETEDGLARLLMTVNLDFRINWDTDIEGSFSDTACTTAVDGKIVCTAVGQAANGNAMLFVNKDVIDDINNWNRVPNATDPGTFTGTACETNDTKTVCIAVGTRALADSKTSMLYVNTNVTGVGSTWDLIESSEGIFNGAACTVTSTDNFACTIAGFDLTGAPLIFTTPNIDSIPWSRPTTTPGLPSDACFYGAGASGANSNLKNCGPAPHVLLSGPVPPIESPVDCDESAQTVVYTVINQAFGFLELDVNIATGDDSSPGSTVVVDTNPSNSTCYGNVNPPSIPGESSCTLSVIITPAICPLIPDPQFIVSQLEVTPEGQDALVAAINVTVEQPTPHLQ